MPELKLFNLEGRAFYIGARFRSLESRWSEWVTNSVWSVPNASFVWKNAFNHFIRSSTLAEEDFSRGRFLVQSTTSSLGSMSPRARQRTWSTRSMRWAFRLGTRTACSLKSSRA